MTSVIQTPVIVKPLEVETVPPQKHGKERAKELWGLLRNSVKLLTDLVKKADIKPSTVSHGVHHMRKINHEETVVTVVYNLTNSEFVTVDGRFINIFRSDGRRKNLIELDEMITDMVWCKKSNQYIAQINSKEMKLLSSEMEYISTSKFHHDVRSMIYNECSNELVTAGSGNLATWCFRYGNRYFIPHRVVVEGLVENDKFDLLALEGSESSAQRCFAVCYTSVAIFNLYKGVLLEYRKDLHARRITSIAFINPMKYLITGSKDGSIKLWDINFEIKHVFVGHYGPVQALAIYPLGPYFMSASQDSTIRVWSLNHCDEVDLLECDEPVEGLRTFPGTGKLFSYSSYVVDLWNIGHLHEIFTITSDTPQKINTVFYPKLIDRTVVQCLDGTVRIICPTNGCVITSILPPWLTDDITPRLTDAAYHLPYETVYVAYDNGIVLKASTATNPAKIIDTWSFYDENMINCLSLYEFILDSNDLVKKWKEKKSLDPPPPKPLRKITKYGNKIILLAGLKSGHIAVIGKASGNISFKIDAHEKHEIISILSYPYQDQVISAGKDNTVRVWRMFPNMADSLSLLMSFFCAHEPSHMVVSHNSLVVAFQQHSTATYTIVVYNLETKERSDHSPDFDHTNEITSLSFCHRLKIFASCSKDNTIRIWNCQNELIRILKLNEDPKSISFCSQRGDILVGLRQNLHYIAHENYMPQLYMFKMVCMEFSDPKFEDPLPINREMLKRYSKESSLVLKQAKSSYMRFDYSWDPMSIEEEAENDKQRYLREMMIAELAMKESNIYKMRDNLIHPRNAYRQTTKRTESRAFKNYMQMIWRKPSYKKMSALDDFTPDVPEPKPPVLKQYVEETKVGFFPPIKGAKPIQEIIKKEKIDKDEYLLSSGPDFEPMDRYPINPQGFIPNSILMRFIWPQEEVEKQKSMNVHRVPEIPPEMLALAEEKKKEREAEAAGEEDEEEEDDDHVFIMPSPSEAGSLLEEEDLNDLYGTGIKPSAGKKKMAKKKKSIQKQPSALLAKIQKAMKTPSPTSTPELPPTPPPAAVPAVVSQKKLSTPTRPTKPIEKLVSRAPPAAAPKKQPSEGSEKSVHSVAALPPPKLATPTPPPTPTPGFMQQFEGAAWYAEFNPYIMQRMKKPYTIAQFHPVVADVLVKSTDWNLRKQIADALLLLWQQENGTNRPYVLAALLSILNHSIPPSPKDPDHSVFLRSAVKLLQVLQKTNEDFIIEILSQYLEGDSHHKAFIKGVLIDVGLQDSHGYLNKELDSWVLWNLTDTVPPKLQIKNMIKKWLHEWTEKFKEHLERVMDQLKKGEVKGKILKSNKPATKQRKSTTSKGHRVHFTVEATEQSLKNLTTIEVCNYFCEVRQEHEFDHTQTKHSKRELKKNTVLVLPKITGPEALVRLGEMHTAHRARVRDELAMEYRLNPLQRPYPNLVDPFTPKIILPPNVLHMNPFPSVLDEYETDTIFQPILLTLRSVHQRYFVPEKSYVHLS